MNEHFDFKINFLSRQNHQLKNDLKIIKSLFYQLRNLKRDERDNKNFSILLEKILIILDIPKEED
jgi:hypothetical protein